ncbi:hypothetical protein [Kitasatospora sp. NPDC054795]
MALSPSGSSVITPDTSRPHSLGASAPYRSTVSARVGSCGGCFAGSDAEVGAGVGAGVGFGPAVDAAAAPAGPPDAVASGAAGPADPADPAGGIAEGEPVPDVRPPHPANAPPATTMSSARRLTAMPVSHPRDFAYKPMT